MAKNTFNIYLTKSGVGTLEKALTEGAHEKLKLPDSQEVKLPNFAKGAKLFVLSGMPDVPKWLKQVNAAFSQSIQVKSRSTAGILMFHESQRIFAVTFGHGWMYLDEEYLENDFGLRASINGLDEKKLKRLERTNLSDALRGSALSPFQRTFESFGIDDALELTRKVSGSTLDGVQGDSMSGSTSLKQTGDFEISDIPKLARDGLHLFNSKKYVGTTFEILDQLRPVANLNLARTLDDEAVKAIMAKKTNFELGLPGEMTEEGAFYKFSGPGFRGLYPDLVMDNYVGALGENLKKLDAETLRSHRIVASYEDTSKPDQNWTIHRSLVGSISHKTNLFAINEGSWYSIDQALKQSVDDGFSKVVKELDVEHLPLAKVVKDQGKKKKYEAELSYNTKCAKKSGYILLDQKFIDIPDIQRSRFEVCDLLDLENKRFIHVKKSSRSSSVLSHFFKQGRNSASHFRAIASCKTELRKRIVKEEGEAKAKEFDEVDGTNKQWGVEFWIADTPRQNGDFNIPFFSKISLRDEVRQLKAMQFNVHLRFIKLVDPIT